MKISKMLLIAALALTMGFTANAQKKAAAKPAAAKTTSAKPTKAETMDWIAGKMQENLATPRKFVSYANGLFVYTKAMYGGEICTTTIDLNKVTGLSNEYSEDFFISGKQLGVTICEKDKTPGYFEYISIAGPNYNDYSSPFNLNTDKALQERMRKALETLFEYNAAGKKKADEKF